MNHARNLDRLIAAARGGRRALSRLLVPVVSAALAATAALAAAPLTAHAAEATDSSAVAWGHDAYGQLGDGATTNHALPVAVMPGVTQLAGGDTVSR